MKEEKMKYPKLEEPCKSCLYKCGRCEEPTFIKDEKCKYVENKNYIIFKPMKGEQEKYDI